MFGGCSDGGGPMPSADEIRDGQRATWAGLSAGWEKWDSVIMDQLGLVGEAGVSDLTLHALLAFFHDHVNLFADATNKVP